MMHQSSFLTVAVALALASVASGEQTYDLQLMADGDSRWVDAFSATFAQLDKTYEEPLGIDGFFQIDEEDFSPQPYNGWTFDYAAFEPVEYVPIGGGGTAFPNGEDFQGGYSIRYDDEGLTGVGREVAPLTGAAFDFNVDVANDDSLSFDEDGYDTVVTSVSGTVTMIDGQVASIDGAFDVTINEDFSAWGLGVLDYTGAVVFRGASWELSADGMHEVGQPDPMRLIWDVHGVVAGLYETGLTGDYNNDGVVDGADYAAWRDRVGARAAALPNDTDGGAIGEAQYRTWADRYGGAAGGVPAPEPSSLWLLAIGALAPAGRPAERRRATA